MSDQPPAPTNSKPWMPRFGIAEMMLAMMIFCVMGAAGGYLKRAASSSDAKPVFVIFTLASPIALVLVLSIYLNIKRWLKK